MGKKKRKEPQETPESNGILDSSSGIFNTLFGEVPEQHTSGSLFSDKNPFRRKPQESGSCPGSAKDTEIPDNGGAGDHDSGELTKRKRKKEKNSTVDSGSAFEASEKKLKLGSDVGIHQGPQPDRNTEDSQAKNTNLGAQGFALSKKKKGKEREMTLQSNNVPNIGEGEDPDSGLRSKEKYDLVNEDKENMKKKRKRDELEEDYEARKYGAVEEKDDGGEGLGNKTVGSKRKTVDNPADMLVSNEGFDDESKLLRTIFVGNLPLKTKKKSLLKEFKKFGEVESVRIRSVPILDTKRPRKGAILSKKINDSAADSVHAYIVFKSEESVEASLSHNMAVVGGNHIRVDRACPPRKKLKGESAPLYDNKRTVFVGNLPFDVKDEEVYRLFSGMANLESSIEAVRVVRDPHINLGKGIAYVLFKTKEAANSVVKKRSLKLRDRELRLSLARSDATPSKRPNSSPAQGPNTPAKKLATSSSSNNKTNSKTNMSYQGVVASKSPSSSNKSGKRKANMSYQGLRAGAHKSSLNTQSGGQPTERRKKRPAVAAKKAKAKSLKDGVPSKQAGIKRKLDGRTPDNSQQKKKVKKNG
ncbi:hypothetical protein L6164_027400 [Bauhinia variegata]|uniref:Uncharacterized protein n=1 Tax=Bauhinia variegata TaxID=167791 RepID=A0ACB9LTM7_BAUVA|nr:hypothetical protein L6164_027400 [Bauhinia variegata]